MTASALNSAGKKFNIAKSPQVADCMSIKRTLASGGLKPCCSGREHKNARCKRPRDPRLIAGGAHKRSAVGG